jgi:SAM-dependent methyltransferase
VALVALTAVCVAVLWRSGAAEAPSRAATRDEAVTGAQRTRWIALAFVPSSLMLGVTAQITSEVAPIPLFWVLGLGLYLLTFVVAFAWRRTAPPLLLNLALPPLVLTVLIVTFFRVTHAPWVLGLHLATFVVAALICHTHLAAQRPGPARLTDFYLCVAIGGALGGVFNGLIAPVAFDGLVEYPAALVLACLLRPSLWGRPRRIGALAAASLLFALIVSMSGRQSVLTAERSFFGVYKVKELERGGERFHALVDGNTIHGLQSLTPGREREPLLYFYRGGPAGQVFAALRERQAAAHVAVVGLGAGSLACYARPADTWTFFEVDPVVERLARNPRLFTLLSRCAPDAPVVLGDGRLAVARTPDHGFDLLVLDAFKSESLPVHLVTREALALYRRKLRPGGVLLFDVSNHYLDLRPVLGALASEAHLAALQREDEGVEAGDRRGRAPSRWVALAPEARSLRRLAAMKGWRPLPASDARVWTDQYSNLVSVLRW